MLTLTIVAAVIFVIQPLVLSQQKQDTVPVSTERKDKIKKPSHDDVVENLLQDTRRPIHFPLESANRLADCILGNDDCTFVYVYRSIPMTITSSSTGNNPEADCVTIDCTNDKHYFAGNWVFEKQDNGMWINTDNPWIHAPYSQK